ncbi:MAG: hypothetical protein K6E67_10595 [Prevotella sp.]|nr:hypothetical protein [Prevotella sp.]
MMKTRCLFISFLMLLTLSATAQKRRAAKPKLTPEQIERQAKLERMTENTQRIVFIDSMVIPKKQFLSAYLLSPEVGQVARHQDIFHTQQQPDAFVHVNDLGTRCYLSLAPTDTTMQLYMSDYLDEHWSRPQLLKGINDDNQFQRVNYPFMMGDGQTFYFAAEGGDGLGGYDIYVTRYDAEEGQFLHPVNIGMPFNSEANDYLYIIDEYSNLGWFATDRNQPADTVCVYLFLPPVTRQTYSASGLTLEEIAPYARIDRIEDTWTDEAPRQEAMERLHHVVERKQQKPVLREFTFVVNDDITYTRLADFRAPGSNRLFQELQRLRQQFQQQQQALYKARDHYAQAGPDERDKLRSEILASEQAQQQLLRQIHETEKTIRNNEILFLTKN